MNFRRLRYIKRCNNFPTVTPINVAEHSYNTTMLAMFFADELNENLKDEEVPRLNTEVVIRKGLLHDLEESFTSDVPYPVKHICSGVNTLLNSCINKKMLDLTSNSEVLKNWEHIREECKSDREGRVIAFCDMLELALYLYEEISVGNPTAELMLDNCNLYLDEFLEAALYEYTFVLSNYTAHTIVPTICSLRKMVQRDEDTNEYKKVNYLIDLS